MFFGQLTSFGHLDDKLDIEISLSHSVFEERHAFVLDAFDLHMLDDVARKSCDLKSQKYLELFPV